MTDLARALLDSGVFQACLTTTMLQYALSDVPSTPIAVDSCAVQNIVAALDGRGDDPEFRSYLAALIGSPAFTNRRIIARGITRPGGDLTIDASTPRTTALTLTLRQLSRMRAKVPMTEQDKLNRHVSAIFEAAVGAP